MAARVHNFAGRDNRYSLHTWINRVVESRYWKLFILVIVLSNTIVMIFETYDRYYRRYHFYFLALERVYLCVYTIEICFKLWAYSWRYFKSFCNCFDVFIIVVSFIDLIMQELTHAGETRSLSDSLDKLTSSSDARTVRGRQSRIQFERINRFLKALRVLRVLRSFRALRVLRTIRFITPIHTIVKTCSKAVPAMASVAFIMIIVSCISALIARNLFGGVCPEKFDNLVKTFFTLFTLLTLDDWYSVYQVCADRELALVQLTFCLLYIFILNFVLLNLLMAVLVDSFQQTLEYDTKTEKTLTNEDDAQERLLENLAQLTREYCNDEELIEQARLDNNYATDPISHAEHSMYRTATHEYDDIDSEDERMTLPKNRSESTGTTEYRRHQSLLRIQKMMQRYFMLMESLEFRMERHEQLAKLAQKSVKLTLTEQDDRKSTLHK